MKRDRKWREIERYRHEGRITTVEEYLNAIDCIYHKFWGSVPMGGTLNYNSKIWYRGVKDESYDMLPSISRRNLNVEYETIFLSKFKSKAIPYLGQLPSYPFSEGLPGYWGWLFLMQHYDVPTRLMDWSEDALVALLFATDLNASEKELAADPGIWCLNPVKLNEAFHFYDFYPPGYIPNVEEKKVYELFGPYQNGFNNKKPCAVYGPLNNVRIVAQKMEKIIISKDARKSINEQLRKYGISYTNLYPELASVSREIFPDIIVG